MKQVVFWGTRGALPTSLTSRDIHEKIVAALVVANGRSFRNRNALEEFVRGLPFAVNGTFGGNSSCVEIVTSGPEHIILDMGSGARPLGQAKIARFGVPNPQTYHIFISHLHWDHLMGFPFFAPMYIPGNRIVIHGCHPRLEEAVRRQMQAPCFPVDYSQAGAQIEFDLMTPDHPHYICGLNVIPTLQLHAGDSYGYRFESVDRTLVYSTDCEHKLEDIEAFERFARFFAGADLVIFDAMYSLAEAASVKSDWGHSSNVIGVELCQAAAARRLALFHHEPVNDDKQLARLLEETRRLEQITRGERPPLEVVSAYDGLILDL
ncbi:phosphoribosyl 1,2-cyclic phosphodiesterase [Azonexus fungiphilus]|uniref:Phosphoribosyl 1,2-cyclic phosphodiesterase n=1 Tax=Azonexus fungiphilus TaxID=146940 RepID=A0A495WHA6_9RHOO|nr:MBL fold metallo-hydrolase [Azonexus fungiphilus]NHC07574.1 MBL fold metallo-hydrolase [Azonexus fungiphilus]RKT60494.1 phosphoribosyl 1,2-cyclic phosphodiesterase [Azonexus fungiphilus]